MSKVFIFDVEVTVKQRLRVQLSAKKLPTKRQILLMLQENEQDDIIDEETLETISLESVELLPQDEDEISDEESEEAE